MNRCSISTAAALGVILACAAHAQTAASSATACALRSTRRAEPVRGLGELGSGYAASESTSGTRVATKIADLPFVVNVITKDFLNDFRLFQHRQQSRVHQLAQPGRHRGQLQPSRISRHLFPVERVLPAGFGRSDQHRPDRDHQGTQRVDLWPDIPGGNGEHHHTQRPQDTSYEDATVTVGQLRTTTRLEGHVDTAVGTILGVQVSNLATFEGMDDLLGSPETYANGWGYQHERGLTDALKFTPNSHSSLILEVDWYKDLSNTADAEQPFDYNSVTKAYTGELAPLNLARFSQGGQRAPESGVDDVL